MDSPLIRIEPGVSVAEVAFGDAEARVLEVFGSPREVQWDWRGLKELRYSDKTIGLSAAGEFDCFIAIPGAEVKLGSVAVIWEPAFVFQFCAMGGEIVESVGFLISESLSVGLTGFHDGDAAQMALHARPTGGWNIDEDRYATPFVPRDIE